MSFQTKTKRICAMIIALVMAFQALVVDGITLNEIKADTGTEVTVNLRQRGEFVYTIRNDKHDNVDPMFPIIAGSVYAIYTDKDTALEAQTNSDLITDIDRGYVGHFTTENDYVPMVLPSVGTYYVAQINTGDNVLNAKYYRLPEVDRLPEDGSDAHFNYPKTINITENNQIVELDVIMGHFNSYAARQPMMSYELLSPDTYSDIPFLPKLVLQEWSETEQNYETVAQLNDDMTIPSYTTRDGSFTTDGFYFYETYDNKGKCRFIVTEDLPHSPFKNGDVYYENTIGFACPQDTPPENAMTGVGGMMATISSYVRPYIDVVVEKTNELGQPMSGVTFEMKGANNTIQRKTTDETGKVRFEDINEDGSNTFVKEIGLNNTVVEQQWLDGFEFKPVKTDGKYEYVLRSTSQRTAGISFIAKDEESAVVPDVTIDIYDKDNNKVFDAVKTGTDGTFNTGDISNGTYYIEVVDVPEGFVKPEGKTEVTFEVVDNNKVNSATVEKVLQKDVTTNKKPITIQKVTKDIGYGEQKASDVEFKVYKPVKWDEYLGFDGDLEVVEDYEARYAGQKVIFTWADKGEFDTYFDRVNQAQAKINRGEPVTEEEYKLITYKNVVLTHNDNGEVCLIVETPAPVDFPTNENSTAVIGEIVLTEDRQSVIKTDENGMATTIPLPYGEYMLVEISDSDYMNTKNITHFVVGDTNEEIVVKVVNDIHSAALNIVKVDSETGKQIEANDAKFKITSNSYSYNGENVLNTTASTLDDGSVCYTADKRLANGQYDIEEVTAPTGYKPLGKTVKLDYKYNGDISVTMDGEDLKFETKDGKINVYIPNERIPNQQIKYYVDEDGNEQMLPGATMQIVKLEKAASETTFNNAKETVIDEWISKKEAHVSDKLSYADIINPDVKFVLREAKAPEGFVKADDVDYTITLDGENIVKMENAGTVIKIEKLDKETNTNVVAEFEIKDKNGEVIKTFDTKNGAATIKNIPVGEYTVTEKLPNGYQADSLDTKIVVENKKEEQVFKIYNNQTYGRVNIVKMGHENKNYKDDKDAKYNVPLEGVEFTLYYKTAFTDKDGKAHKVDDVAAVVKTDKNGAAVIENLPAFIYENGKYKEAIHYALVETKTIENYELMETGVKDFVFEYKDLTDSENKFVERTFNFTNDKPVISVEKHGTPKTFEGAYEALDRSKVQALTKDEEIVYTITVFNNGLATAKNIMVKDTIPEGMEFVKTEEVKGITETTKGDTHYWVIDEIPVGGTHSIVVTCKVVADKPIDIINKAYAHLPMNDAKDKPEDVKYELETDEVVYTTTKVGYTIDKERVTIAPQKGTEDKKYGFNKDEVVTYRVTIENTGTTELTMDVEDKFENADYFTDLQYIEVKNATWNNEKTSKGKAEAPNITIEADKTATITITAKVSEKAKQLLAGTAADNKEDDKDGYLNVVTASDVTAKAYLADGKEYTITKEDNKELDDKTAQANTPVQSDTDGFDKAPVLGPNGNSDMWARLIIVNFYSAIIILGCVLYLIETKDQEWMKNVK